MKTDKKLALFPQSTAVDTQGHLSFHGQRAIDLVETFGTPLYIYDTDTIRQQIDAYRQGLAHYPGESHLTYASKAFLCTALAELMTHEKVGFDVASAGELFIAQKGGGDPALMHMHGNNKSQAEIRAALQANIGRIVVDNETELTRVSALAQAQNKPVKTWLRVTPDVAVDTHHRYTVTGTVDSKFGMAPDLAETVARQILETSESPITLMGFHAHLGSYFHDSAPVTEALGRLLDIASSLHEDYDWKIREICPGGGWGVRYHPEDPEKPIVPFIEGIATALASGCQARGLPLPTLILEPGRSLIAQAGVALYTVGSRKAIPDTRTYVNVDGGLADNPRPALYQAQYSALLANRANEEAIEIVAIAGPYCESGDVLIEAVPLPVAQTDDILAVPVSGAYQLAMSSNYNGALKPAVLFLDHTGPRLVQRRETLEDLIRRDIG